MLTWAREEVGYSISQASQALGISVKTLEAAESGEKSLTLAQLKKAAEQYDIPLGFFYLSKPPHPKSYKPIPDFRIEPGHIGANHYRLNLEIKKARERREVFIDLARSLEMDLKRFTLLPENLRSPGTYVRDRLGVSDDHLRKLNIDQVYGYWKEKIENDGVLVFESQYIPDVSRVIGAAIYYDFCPIILIKRGSGANERRLFTLVHEYAHILKGRSAINDAESQIVDVLHSQESQLESQCNNLAAQILVPSENVDLSDYLELTSIQKMEFLSKRYKVTYMTAAVCLKRLGLISSEEMAHLLEIRRQANRDKVDHATDAHIPREVIMRLDMGRPIFDAVIHAYNQGILDIFDASKILKLRVHKIDKLVAQSG